MKKQGFSNGRTYKRAIDYTLPIPQTEYVEETSLLNADGTLNAKGWAKHNVFSYDRNLSIPRLRRKEWDFYQISDGRYMVQVSFANISLGGYAAASLTDLGEKRDIVNATSVFLFGKDRYILPAKGDRPHTVDMRVGKAHFSVETSEDGRQIYFFKGDVECSFYMRHLPGHENITTVLPFEGYPTRYFMTTKLNCMPTSGQFKYGDKIVTFDETDTFGVLDWGRVNTPYRLVWFWGNGSAYITDEKGDRHLFGFEITWGIGDESSATETCLFLDGKAYKIGAVDVETFPKPDKYMQPWHFISSGGCMDLTMTPEYDHHNDLNILVARMNTHQVHGKWSGTVTIAGKCYDIRDIYAFCEYVENRW